MLKRIVLFSSVFIFLVSFLIVSVSASTGITPDSETRAASCSCGGSGYSTTRVCTYGIGLCELNRANDHVRAEIWKCTVCNSCGDILQFTTLLDTDYWCNTTGEQMTASYNHKPYPGNGY